MTLETKLEELLVESKNWSASRDGWADTEHENARLVPIIRSLIEALKLAREQRDDALNWAVDDRGQVIHELAPERDALILAKLEAPHG